MSASDFGALAAGAEDEDEDEDEDGKDEEDGVEPVMPGRSDLSIGVANS